MFDIELSSVLGNFEFEIRVTVLLCQYLVQYILFYIYTSLMAFCSSRHYATCVDNPNLNLLLKRNNACTCSINVCQDTLWMTFVKTPYEWFLSRNLMNEFCQDTLWMTFVKKPYEWILSRHLMNEFCQDTFWMTFITFSLKVLTFYEN